MELGFAEQPPIGKEAFPITSEAYQVFAEIDLSTVYDRLYRETIRLIETHTRAGLSGEALARAVTSGLRDLGNAPIERAARGTTTKAFNLGRNIAAQNRADEIGEVVRTAVLDVNTCTEADFGDGVRRCYELDGFTTTVNGPGYFEHMPPKDCEGHEMCRCFYLYRTAA